MSDVDPPGKHNAGGGAEIAHFPRPAAEPPAVSFDRFELRQIMDLYGRMVAIGEWRDYAIDFLRDKAVFSVFRRASRDAALPHRQGSRPWPAARAPTR